jgi:hypothetical protein
MRGAILYGPREEPNLDGFQITSIEYVGNISWTPPLFQARRNLERSSSANLCDHKF